MACLEASCFCGWMGFSNDSKTIAKCPKCGKLTRISHDEYGFCPNPLEGEEEDMKK